MDRRRQDIASSQQERRDLEGRALSLRTEKLQLQERMQRRQSLVDKRGELAAEVEACEREVKVGSEEAGGRVCTRVWLRYRGVEVRGRGGTRVGRYRCGDT